MKYIVDKINSRLDIAEVISKYEDSIKLSKWNKGKIKKGSMFELWDNFKWPNMHATWVLKEEKIREQKKKKIIGRINRQKFYYFDEKHYAEKFNESQVQETWGEKLHQGTS